MTDTVLIRSPQHYSSLLTDPNPVVRNEALALLIEGHPQALRFARAEGSFVFEALSSQLESSISSDADVRLLQALDRLDDPRACDELVRVLMYASRPEALQIAAAALARWQGTGSQWLSNALHDPRRPHLHALVAPHIQPQAPAPDAVRSALVLVARTELDPLAAPDFSDAAVVASYRQELRGTYANEVRHVAEAHGQEAFEALVAGFAQLRPPDQRWLVRWGGRLRSLPAINLLDGLLATDTTPPDLLATTLEAVVALGPMAATLTPRLHQLQRRHIEHPPADESPVSAPLAAALQAATGSAA